jgi:hypothetical protein
MDVRDYNPPCKRFRLGLFMERLDHGATRE